MLFAISIIFVSINNIFSFFNFLSPAQAQSVINLTQTGCQFIETEAKNYGYQPQKAVDCRQINQDSLAVREKGFKPINLKAGKYVFKVTNQNVPYELGFYLRGQGLSQAVLPRVSGGGLTTGKTIEYIADLKKGKYWISCPLNPTPDYPLIVN
ncbi:MAG: hypothetical protein IGQ45_03645 [Cyanobacterium sp. T60_A2020_053]|nr:hypothetical protein [Cyanobacterium sp. T60_A2020_053]